MLHGRLENRRRCRQNDFHGPPPDLPAAHPPIVAPEPSSAQLPHSSTATEPAKIDRPQNRVLTAAARSCESWQVGTFAPVAPAADFTRHPSCEAMPKLLSRSLLHHYTESLK